MQCACSSIPLEETDQDQYTPLLTAVSYGSLAIVRMLLKEGAKIDVMDDEEKNAVYLATEFDQKEVLKVGRITDSIA
jgi:ankyrin repeat protein